MFSDFTIASRQGAISRIECGVSGGKSLQEPSEILLSSVRYDRTQTHRLTHEEAEDLARRLLAIVKAQRRLLPKAKRLKARGEGASPI